MRQRKSVKYAPENCVFCFTDDVEPLLGPMVEKSGTRMHTNCIFTASGISQETEVPSEDSIEGFQLQSIVCEVKRGSRLCCSLCRKLGACIGCAVARCAFKFHLPCLIKARGLTLFRDPFPSYCWRHAARQDLQPWLKITEEPPSCCVCLFSIIPDGNVSPRAPAKTPGKSMPPPPQQQQISLPTPVQPAEKPKHKLGRPPRRTCITMSTPKRIRVSYGMSSIKQRLSLSNTSSTWELPDSSPEPDDHQINSPETTPTATADPSELPTELHQLPNWFSEYLLRLPEADRLHTYETWLHDTVHGCCCPKSWLHRDCIAGFAVSAALHFIKCPYCADKDVFISSIIEAGIWIPDRDAAWELEPGAFAELEPTAHSSDDGAHQSQGTDSNLTNANTSSNLNGTNDSQGHDHSTEATILSSLDTNFSNTERSTPRGRRSSRPLTRKPTTRRRGRPRRQHSEQPTAEPPVRAEVVEKDDKPPQLFSLVWSNGRFSSITPGRRRSSGRAKRKTVTRRYTQATSYNSHQKSPVSEEPVHQRRRGSCRRPRSPIIPLRSPTESRMRQSTLGDFLHRYGIHTSSR